MYVKNGFQSCKLLGSKDCGHGGTLCTLRSTGSDFNREHYFISQLDAGQPKILALVHVIQRPTTVHYEDSDKVLYLA